MTATMTHISDGPVGERLWWFGEYCRIRRVPAGYSDSGKVEYWTDHLATPTIFFSRYNRYWTWRKARWAIANPWEAQSEAEAERASARRSHKRRAR